MFSILSNSNKCHDGQVSTGNGACQAAPRGPQHHIRSQVRHCSRCLVPLCCFNHSTQLQSRDVYEQCRSICNRPHPHLPHTQTRALLYLRQRSRWRTVPTCHCSLACPCLQIRDVAEPERISLFISALNSADVTTTTYPPPPPPPGTRQKAIM
jgi:hypothetical protein